MDNLGNTIKQLITMADVLRQYGFPTSMNGRIPCPLHNGKDNNFSYKDHYFKCFVCGRGGSVIDFVMELFDINYRQALLRINQDFSLGLTGGAVKRSELSLAVRKAQQEKRDAERREDEWWAMIRELWYYREIVKEVQPVLDGDSIWFHPLYLEAIRLLPKIENWLDQRFQEGDNLDWKNCQSTQKTTS